jgi:hypothetical protein
VHSNRLNPATYTILKMIGEKFAAAGDGHSVWRHVIVGYSKCNAHDFSWQVRAGWGGETDGERAGRRQGRKQPCWPSCSLHIFRVDLFTHSGRVVRGRFIREVHVCRRTLAEECDHLRRCWGWGAAGCGLYPLAIHPRARACPPLPPQAAIAKKKKDLQAAIRAKVPSCDMDVPVRHI